MNNPVRPLKAIKKNDSSRGLSSLSFILFLVSFIAILVLLGAQYAGAPTPALGQSVLMFNSTTNMSYLATFTAKNTTLISNIPNPDVSAIRCGLGFVIIDGLAGCVWNYGSAFVAFMAMSSDNTFMTILLGVLLLGLAWSIATLWGGT